MGGHDPVSAVLPCSGGNCVRQVDVCFETLFCLACTQTFLSVCLRVRIICVSACVTLYRDYPYQMYLNLSVCANGFCCIDDMIPCVTVSTLIY